MRHSYKRAIAFLISLTMLISMFPSTYAFADDTVTSFLPIAQESAMTENPLGMGETTSIIMDEEELLPEAVEGSVQSKEDEFVIKSEDQSDDALLPILTDKNESSTVADLESDVEEWLIDPVEDDAVAEADREDDAVKEEIIDQVEDAAIEEDEIADEDIVPRTSDTAIETEEIDQGFMGIRRDDIVYEVTFNVPSGSTGKFPQYITEGATAYDPGPVQVPSPNPLGYVSFLGWYLYGTTDDNPFDFSTPIMGDTAIWARFSREYLISYLNGFGDVFITKRISPDMLIPGLTFQEMLGFTAPIGEYFNYWEILDEQGHSTGIEFTPDTDYPVRDIILKPVLDRGVYNVYFSSEGTQVPFQTIRYGERVVKPTDPTRNGYIFDHWSTTSEGKISFDFNAPVTDNITLYAVWIPQPVTYQVIFFNEKANILGVPSVSDDFELSRSFILSTCLDVNSATQSALAGMIVTDLGIKKFVEQQSANWPKYSSYYVDINANGFTSNSSTLLGNNGTVINVYFKRNVYDLYFSLQAAEIGGNPPIYYTSIKSSMQFINSPGAIKYLTTDDTSAMYKISAKYEQYIGDLWPSTENASVVIESKEPGYDTTRNYVYMGWVMWKKGGAPLTNNVLSTKRSSMSDELIGTSGSDNPLYLYYQLTNSESYIWNYHCMFESLANETASLSFAGKSYTESMDHSQMNVNSMTNSIYLKAIEGFVASPNTFYVGTSYAQYRKEDGTFVALPYSGIQPSKIPVDIYLFYDRIQHSLKFDVMSLAATPPQLNVGLDYNSIKFGESLEAYKPIDNPTRVEEGSEYIFDGWYYDADYMKPFSLDDRMPDSDITLFAKWRIVDYVVTLYDDASKDRKVGEVVIERNGFIDPNTLPFHTGQHYARGTFLGWQYYRENNVMYWFNFDTTPITQNLDLHAAWQASAFRVNYHNSLDPNVIGTPPVDANSYQDGSIVRVKGDNGMEKTPVEDNVFVGWRKDNYGTLERPIYYDGSFTDIAGMDIDFYPEFALRADSINISFYKNDDIVPEQVIVRLMSKGAEIPMPDEYIFTTSRAGYFLAGWTLDRNDTTRGLLEPGVLYELTDKDTDFYAYWVEKNFHKVVFDLRDKNDGIAYGDTSDTSIYFVQNGLNMMAAGVVPPRVIADEVHAFVRWSASYDDSATFDPYYVPTSIVTYTAIYRLLPDLPQGLVQVYPYEDIYDGNYHSVTVVLDSSISSFAPQFSNDGLTWSTINPSYKNVNGNELPYPVWVKVKVSGFAPYITESSVSIKRKDLDIKAPDRTIRVGTPLPSDAAWSLTFAGFVGGEGLADITATGDAKSFHLDPPFVLGVVGAFPTIVDNVFNSNNYNIIKHDGELVVTEANSLSALTKQVWDGKAYADYLHITDKDKILQYRIRFTLPEDMGGYSTLEVQDILPVSLKLASVSGNNVEMLVNGVSFNNGTWDTNKYPAYGGGVISFTFNPASLPELAGKTIDMIVQTELADRDFAGNIQNAGRVLVNRTTPPDQAIAPPSAHEPGPIVAVTNTMDSIVKSIWDSNKSEFVDSINITDPAQILKYQIAVKMPAVIDGITSVEIQDILPEQLVLSSPPSVPVMNQNVWLAVSGSATTLTGTLTMKGSNIVSFLIEDLSLINDLAEQTVLMTVDTKLVNNASGRILNQVKVIINGDSTEDGKPPLVIVMAPITNVTKEVYNGSTYVNHFELQDRNKTLVYRINAEIPTNVTSYTSIEIQDILPDVLTVASVSANYIIGTAETELIGVSPVLKTDTGGRTVISYTVSDPSVISLLAGKILSLKVNAKIKAATPAFVGKITNIGQVILNNGVAVVTNPVDVVVTNAIEEITKKIWNGTEFVDDINITDKDAVLRYQISIKLPDDVTSYTSIELQDILPDSLKLETNNLANDVTITVPGLGTALNLSPVLKNGNIISYFINDLMLIKQLEGKTVVVIVSTKLAGDAFGIIENIGCVLVNGANGETDIPKVIVTDPVKDISKTVKDPETGLFGSYLRTQDRDQVLTYRVTAQIPADVTSYTGIELIDVLPSSLRLADPANTAARVYVISNGVTTGLNVGAPTFAIDAQGRTVVSYVLTDQVAIRSLTGKALCLEIDTKIVDPNFAGRIYNEGYVTVNGGLPLQAETPDVVVTEPMSKVDKQIQKADGSWGDNLQITDKTQKLTYRIAAVLPINTTSYVSIEIQDILPTSLSLDTNNVNVDVRVSVSGGGVDLSGQAAPILKNGNVVSYTITGEAILLSLSGKTVVLEVDTRLINQSFSGLITNVGRVIVNGKHVSDDVNPPKVVVIDPDSFSKTVWDSEKGDYVDTLNISAETKALSYQISLRLPTDMTGFESIELSDIMPSTLVLSTSALATSVKVSVNGTDITSRGLLTTRAGVTSGDVIVSFFTNDAGILAMAGAILVMNLDARIKNGVTGRIDNKGQLVLNGGPEIITTPPGVVVTNPVEGLTKKIWNGSLYVDGFSFSDKSEILRYQISFRVPLDTTSYASLTVMDIMPTQLKLAGTAGDVSISIDGTEATALGTLVTVGNVVQFTFASDTDFASMAGKTVTMTVQTKLADEAYVGAVNNIGRVIVNKLDPQDADGPSVVIVDPIEGLTKLILAEDGTYTDQISINDKTAVLQYEIAFIMPANAASYASIEIQDLLPDILTLAPGADAVTVTVNGTDFTFMGTVSIKPGNIVSFVFDEATDFVAFAGARVAMVLKTRLTANKGGKINNTGRIIVNGGNPKDVDGPDVVVISPVEDLTKQVWDGTAYVNQLTITDKQSILQYRISFRLPADTTSMSSLVVQDILPGSLRLADSINTSVTVTADGADVTSAGKLEQIGSTISYTFANTTNFTALAGKTISMTISTRLADSNVTGRIYNTGRVIVNNKDPEDTDGPSVVVVNPVDNLTKKILNEAGEYVSQFVFTDTTAVLQYMISFNVPVNTTSYTGLEIQDIMPSALTLAGDLASSVKVTLDGADITAAGRLAVKDGNIISYTFAEGTDFAAIAGKSVTMTIQTKITSVAASIQNIGRIKVNGVPGGENPGPDVKYSMKVTFNGNGGTVSSPDYRMVTPPTVTVSSLPTATRTGYNFNGWNTKSDGSGTAFTTGTVVNESITVYAVWTAMPVAVSLRVTFDGNGGTVAAPDYRMVTPPAATVSSLPTATRTGYNFSSWNTKSDGSGTAFTTGTVVSQNITVYAIWTAVPPVVRPPVDPPGDGKGEIPGGGGGGDKGGSGTTGGGGSSGPDYVTEPPLVIIPPEDIPAAIVTAPPSAPVRRPAVSKPIVEVPDIVVIEPPEIPTVEPPIITIPPEEPPIAPPTGVWAMVNLILAVLGGLIALLLLLTAIRRRRIDEAILYMDVYEEEESVRSKGLRALWRVLGILSGIAGLSTFIVTENITQRMVMTDKWTALMVGLMVLAIVFAFLVFYRKRNPELEEGEFIDFMTMD